jgi:hypothetical protein
MAETNPIKPEEPANQPTEPANKQPEQQKVVSVQAIDEGPRIRPKRQMTEAQLEILKKGREKLAEKRRLMKEEALTQSEPQPQQDEKTHEETRESEENQEETQEDSYVGGPLYCTIQ